MNQPYAVTVMPGDGIGPEVMDATIKVLEATGVKFDWHTALIGERSQMFVKNGLSEGVLNSIRRTRVAIKGPTATPVGRGHRSINVRLREEFNLLLNVRPVETTPVKTRYSDVPIDLVIYRMNSGDLYVGIEDSFDTGAKAEALFAKADCERFATMAYSHARAAGRKKMVIGHKANILKKTHGLFLESARKVSREFPQIETVDMIADNLAMQLVMRPERFDCLLLPNFIGDLYSDMCAGFVGGLGFAPGGNIGNMFAIFEAVHGTAPDIAGKGLANPSALILSGAMMLDYLGEYVAAKLVQGALRGVVAAGNHVTRDVNPERFVSTDEFADAVIRVMTI